MRYPEEIVEEVRMKNDIVDVVSGYVRIQKKGASYFGLCPFHNEKSPSFSVHGGRQMYHCFGCGKGGDVIRFVMEAEHLDYPEAVRFLAARCGMTVPEDGDDRAAKRKMRVYEINREAAHFFHKCLKSPAGKEGYDYLRKRGLSDQTIVTYGLGFAPNTWDSLRNHLQKKGFTREEMIDAAVLSQGKNGSAYDKFRNRVMFPIIDVRGNVIGFGGRVMDDSKPKYLNTDDTPVFKKSRNLFSLNFAKNEGGGRLILAEGYMDVIAIYAAGFKNVVATLGTALTEEQARLMSKYAKEVIIAYDSDGAGQAATRRALNILSEAGLTARVLHMEGAKDPDEYIAKFGTKRFEMLLDDAGDPILHELESIKKSVDIKTPEGKIEYSKRAVFVLSDVADPLARAVYAGVVSKTAEIAVDTLMAQAENIRKKRIRQAEAREWRDIEMNREMVRDRINPEKAQNIKAAAAEEGILSYMLRHPDECGRILETVSEDDFVTAYDKKVLAAMRLLHDEHDEITLTTLSTLLSPDEASGVARILARSSEAPVTQEMLSDYVRVLAQERQKLKKESIASIDPAEIERYRQKLREKRK